MKKKKKRIRHTTVIGVTGCIPHVGVTHLTIMLANYLSSKERYVVAAMDMSENNTFGLLKEILEEQILQNCMSAQMNENFQVYKVNYYCKADWKGISDILQMGYEYVIVDLGIDVQKSRQWIRCDKIIMVGSCCEWQYKQFQDEILKCQSDGISWEYASFLGIDEVRRSLEK